jgi:hypothetical protein
MNLGAARLSSSIRARSVFVCAAVVSLISGAQAIDLVVTTLDGSQLQGSLQKLAPELAIRTDEKDIALDWSEVLSLRPLSSPAQALAGEEQPLRFTLADGSVFGARVESADSEPRSPESDESRHGETQGAFRVRFGADQSAAVRSTMIRSIASSRASLEARRLLEAALEDASRDEDVAIVTSDGQVVELRGRLRGIGGPGVEFEWRGRTVSIPWDRFAALAPARPAQRGASAKTYLHGGDVFAGRVAGGGQDAVILQSGTLGSVPIAWERIERIECRSERLVFLSELQPAGYEFEAFFDRRWEYVFDRTFSGAPISLAGRVFERGVVMHSRSRLGFQIAGRARQFAATVGVIDEMGHRGDARVAVLGDGRLLWEAQHVRGGEPPQTVLVDVSGVDSLELLVDFGEDLDLSDQVAWAMARLIR